MGIDGRYRELGNFRMGRERLLERYKTNNLCLNFFAVVIAIFLDFEIIDLNPRLYYLIICAYIFILCCFISKILR